MVIDMRVFNDEVELEEFLFNEVAGDFGYLINYDGYVVREVRRGIGGVSTIPFPAILAA
jgi:hypothetical protein